MGEERGNEERALIDLSQNVKLKIFVQSVNRRVKLIHYLTKLIIFVE